MHIHMQSCPRTCINYMYMGTVHIYDLVHYAYARRCLCMCNQSALPELDCFCQV